MTAKTQNFGKPGTAAQLIRSLIMKGQDNEKISQVAKKRFPKAASTTPAHVSWYRAQMRRSGVKKVPGSGEE